MLSFSEFKAIIRTRVPDFSDRRILRMFREALMGGADQSFALSMAAFVVVCSDHGLVSLLPEDRLKDPFARPKKRPLVAKDDASNVATLPSALDALVLSPGQTLAAAPKAGEEQNSEDGSEVALLELPGVSLVDDIPEELPLEADPAPLASARAEEVDDDDDVDWQW